MFPQVQQQLTNKMKEDHQQVITTRNNKIKAFEFTNEEERQANGQEILRLIEEVNDVIGNWHVARGGCFDNVVLTMFLMFFQKEQQKDPLIQRYLISV